MKTYFPLALVSLLAAHASADSVDIRIQCDKPTASLSPHLYGLFFEDINFGADGGLYAELVQNRSFEYFSVEGGGRAYHPLATPVVSVASTLDRSTGEVIVKLVNPGTAPVDATISLHGTKRVQPQAELITLEGDGGAVNTLENPDTVKPEAREITVSYGFQHQIPAMSVQFIRVKTE